MEQVNCEVNGHGVQCLGRHFESLVGLLDRLLLVVIFERELGKQLLGFDHFRGELQRALGEFHGLLFESIRGQKGCCIRGAGMLLVNRKRFLEKLFGFVLGVSFQEQHSPTNPQVSVTRLLGDSGTERQICGLVVVKSPKTFCFSSRVRIGG